MILLIVQFSFASAVLNVSEEIDLGMGGTWVFPINHDNQWKLAMGQQQDLLLAPLDIGTMTVDMTSVQNLSQHGGLVDHALRPCHNGGYLHIGSPGVSGNNPFFQYDSDFELVQQGTIEQLSPEHAANDPSAICSPHFKGVGLAEQQGLRDYFRPIDDTGQVAAPIELLQSPRLTGAGMIEDDQSLVVVSQDATPELTFARYDLNLNLIENWTIERADIGIVHYWPSAVLMVEDRFLVLTMGRDPADQFQFDLGNMYLAILDSEFSLLEWIQISENTPEIGGMRPWMDRNGDTLIIGYDKLTSMHLFRVTLDLDAMRDSEPTESDENSLTPTPSLESSPKEGGCLSAAALPPCLLVGMRRRQRKQNHTTTATCL